MRRILLLAALAVVCMATAVAQRYVSPPATTSITIAGKRFRIDYFTPSMHGRKIMGGLVPFNRVWAAGANIADDFQTEADLQIGDLKLPQGHYSIWTIPGEKEWTLILNTETGQSHLEYDPSLDFGRTKMTIKTLPEPVETLKIELRSNGGNQGTLAVSWETTEASIPFTVLP